MVAILIGEVIPHCSLDSHFLGMLSMLSPSGQDYGFSSGHVWMWELDYKDTWVLNIWCFWTVVLEKTNLESPLDCKETQPVHLKGDQSWVFFGRNDAKAETPVLWPPHVKSWLIGKDSDAGSDWGSEEKGTTEDEMAGWHHWLDGHEFEWSPGVGDGQGGLVCCDSWHRKELDTTERLNWTELNFIATSGTCYRKYYSNLFHCILKHKKMLCYSELVFNSFFIFTNKQKNLDPFLILSLWPDKLSVT